MRWNAGLGGKVSTWEHHPLIILVECPGWRPSCYSFWHYVYQSLWLMISRTRWVMAAATRVLTSQYKTEDEVIIYVNRVGPANNPQESYAFYSRMPYCAPDPLVQGRFEGLGEAIQGYELIQSNMKLHFRENIPTTVYCNHTRLSHKDFKAIESAVQQKYYFEFFAGSYSPSYLTTDTL